MNARTEKIIVGVILVLGLGMSMITLNYSHSVSGMFGFPLDDPWIHLQFAKNLHDYGSFSYYKNEMVTSGSTSPLYTFLLAIGFFVTQNEMILSYVLGIMFFLISGVYFYLLLQKYFPEHRSYIVGGVGLLLFEPRLQWAALSGMETTLFVALLLATLYYYVRQQWKIFGISAGLLIWSRPEALLFVSILFIDKLYQHYVQRRSMKGKKSNDQHNLYDILKPALPPLLILWGGYFAFNLYLSGFLFPNTYAAKLKYYASGNANYWQDVIGFLSNGHLSLLWFVVLIGFGKIIVDILQRKTTPHVPSALFVGAMVIAFGNNLPRLYQEGRYLMPILPFIIILGISGIKTSVEIIKKIIPVIRQQRLSTVLVSIIMLVLVIQFMTASWNKRSEYQKACQHINGLQVQTARWIKEHLPEQSIIATHDIGAIAFYSGRRVVDMVGLVSPEFIYSIGQIDKLLDLLRFHKVTHLATLVGFLDIVNSELLFHTDDTQDEVMEVYAFDSHRTHFTPPNVAIMTETAVEYLHNNDAQSAISILDQALRVDPKNSKAHYLMGYALLLQNKNENAEQWFQSALSLFPTHWDSQFMLAEIARQNNNPMQALTLCKELINKKPDYAEAYRLLAEVYSSDLHDTSSAAIYAKEYNRLISSK